MWLHSFAWRNRNHTQKQKGKREGWAERRARERENKCRPTLQSIALPSEQASLTRTTSFYAWQTIPLQQANCLLKCARKENRNSRTLSTIWELLAGLHNTPIAPALHCPLDMHPACCSLHFEVVHRAMELWLSCPLQTFSSCSELCAADCRSRGATAPRANCSPFWFSLWMLN